MIGAGDRALTYKDLKVTYDATPGSLLLVAHQGSRVPLLVAPESDYTRQADSLGVSEESKIGFSDFDQKYVVRDGTGKAKSVLTSEVLTLVEAMEPFTELELCDDMVRLLKKPGDETTALKDVESLASLCKYVG